MLQIFLESGRIPRHLILVQHCKYVLKFYVLVQMGHRVSASYQENCGEALSIFKARGFPICEYKEVYV